MPWSAKDASKKTKKADTKGEQKQWSKVANSVLKRGGSEASAIRQASGVIKKRSRGK